jgi:hypothetical protein
MLCFHVSIWLVEGTVRLTKSSMRSSRSSRCDGSEVRFTATHDAFLHLEVQVAGISWYGRFGSVGKESQVASEGRSCEETAADTSVVAERHAEVVLKSRS